jgi:hypothetical protein
MPHPYSDVPAMQIARRAPADPQIGGRFRLTRSDRIASAGSCFAQRITDGLRNSGYRYLVTEPGNSESYSARYGEIYSTLQLLQIAQAATGAFVPAEQPWPADDGRWLDPFRPRIEPGGFASPQAVIDERKRHLAAVKTLLEEADVFVFTAGLTETWCSKIDGAAFPICPGTGVGSYDSDRYIFRNLGIDENIANLDAFLKLAWSLNPALRVIFTVSPVPLAATMEPRHVVQSTTWSKSVLRVAVEEMRRRYELVDYFAAYEIVMGARPNGFEDDGRTVTPAAVNTVVASFFRHFGEPLIEAALETSRPRAPVEHDVCDDTFLDNFLEEQREHGGS